MTETVYSEREQHLIEMNRSLRRCLFHAVRMSGGELRIREHDLVKYPEAGESLRWRTDMERGDIILRAEMVLPTVEFDLGEKYRDPAPRRFARLRKWLGRVHLQCLFAYREALRTYRVLFGGLGRSRKARRHG